MDKLRQILPRVVASQPGSDRVRAAATRLRFSRLFPDLASRCDEVDLVRGTLILVTADPALAHQIRIDGESLLERMNHGSELARVRRLRVTIGRRSPSR